MLIQIHNDPQFVTTRELVIFTEDGQLELPENEPISLSKDSSGRVFIGDEGNVVEIVHKTALKDLLENLSPASFNASYDDEGDFLIEACITEAGASIKDLIARIPQITVLPESTFDVVKIRTL